MGTNFKVVIFFFIFHNKYLINKFCPASQSRSKFRFYKFFYYFFRRKFIYKFFFKYFYWKICGKYSTSYPFIITKEYFSFYTYQRKNTKTSFSITIFYTNYLKVRNVNETTSYITRYRSTQRSVNNTRPSSITRKKKFVPH